MARAAANTAVQAQTPQEARETALYEAFMAMKSADEMRRFLADLCTPGEIAAFAERWEIARLLKKGDMGYRDIAQTAAASTTTVSRVARFLHQERHQGYQLALDRLTKK